jgi:hypothetical protein
MAGVNNSIASDAWRAKRKERLIRIKLVAALNACPSGIRAALVANGRNDETKMITHGLAMTYSSVRGDNQALFRGEAAQGSEI